ncbi:unnamed protein product, partial [Rangifer tarandus platyrhynchus]
MTTSPTHPFWPLGLRLDSSVPDDCPPPRPRQILPGPSVSGVSVVTAWLFLCHADLSETKPSYLNFGK